MKKHLLVLTMLLICLFSFNVSADHIVTLIEPADGNECIVAGNVSFRFYIDEVADGGCDLYTNISGSWAVSEYHVVNPAVVGYNSFNYFFDESNIVYWGLGCHDISPPDLDFSDNFTFTITDAPYCATLSETVCPSETPIGSTRFFQTRLGNTKGLWLENQDCNVWITDNDSLVVESFDSMMYNADVGQALDDNGNIINLVKPDFPVTDSNGYYIFPVVISDDWAEYGREFTWHVSCNGQKETCDFNVSRSLNPIDSGHFVALGKDLGGTLLVFLGLIMLLYITYKKLRRR